VKLIAKYHVYFTGLIMLVNWITM